MLFLLLRSMCVCVFFFLLCVCQFILGSRRNSTQDQMEVTASLWVFGFHIAFKLRIKCMRIIVLFSLCSSKTQLWMLCATQPNVFWCWFSFYVDNIRNVLPSSRRCRRCRAPSPTFEISFATPYFARAHNSHISLATCIHTPGWERKEKWEWKKKKKKKENHIL